MLRDAVLIFILVLSVSSGASDLQVFNSQGALISTQTRESLKSKTSEKESTPVRSLAFLGLGILHLNANELSEAEAALNESLRLGTRLEDYARFHLGLVYQRTDRIEQAKKELNKVVQFAPPSARANDARFALGEIALEKSSFREARLMFASMERKSRRTAQYPDVIWNLARAEWGLGQKSQACRWLKKLFTRHPGEPITQDWGVDLAAVQINGKSSGCMVGPEDLKRRMRSLQHAGLNQKARQEIEVLRKRSPQEAKVYSDMMLANFLVNDGFVEEATQLLKPYYQSHASNFSYLSLVAKAAARSGDFALASDANMRAHRAAPSSRQGREALFQAAFLSYQSKDYDGATTKFSSFLKKYPSSGLSRDSRWYLAWIHYLKEDFKSSEKAFADLKRVRTRRGRQNLTSDRLDYWRAMSLLKQGQVDEARKIFQEVSLDSLHGYYAIAARARIQLIDQDQKTSPAMARAPASEKPLTGPLGPPSEALVLKAPLEVTAEEGAPDEATAVRNEEEEGEDQIQAEAPDASEGESANSEEGIPLRASFKDPRLEQRFQRASDLAALGLNLWARSELIEIERRTRNRDYLKSLINEYEKIHAFDRSANIGFVDFGVQRASQGLERGRTLWQASYPKAFAEAVGTASQQFGVPTEFVWSIMRAESRYNPKVISPVGAMGLLQLMPYTAERVASLVEMKSFRNEQLFDPNLNVKLGTRYLKRLSDKLNANYHLVAAAYNAGPHRVAAWLKAFGHLDNDEFIEHIPFVETRNYVKKVVHNYFVYTQVYKGGQVKGFGWLTQPPTVQLEGPVPTREDWEAL